MGENMTNAEIRLAFLMLAQVMTAQVSREVVALVDPIMSRATLKVRDFVRMNPLEFYGSKVGEGPQEFIDEVSKMLDLVGVTPVKKVELASYQLKWVAQVQFNQWKKGRPVGIGPIEWEVFKSAFLDKLFPLEMRESLVLEFINLRQGDMSVKEYALSFTRFSRYVPILVSDPRLGMKKLEERLRERKRLRIENENYSLESSFGQGPSRFPPKFSEERVSNHKPRRRRDSKSLLPKPTYARCVKRHEGICLARTEGYYGCGENGHKMRDCPVLKAQGRKAKQVSPSGSSASALKQTRSFSLQARGEQECPPNVSPGMCFMLI
ncbi:uncharacterized protein LOC125827304 [Solanum verrucosum]|uniref:uncharacterized protein LOC125827304 n=1 Tax=Solanum verrucosum TaxID=315347 RepID=UPI0020D14FC7|nr:uncharacterized protein LOC125827304 [Solanum verrucosum]